MLADHGAEVIKVEPPGEGDPTRHLGPRDGGETVYFRNLNRGKKASSSISRTRRTAKRCSSFATPRTSSSSRSARVWSIGSASATSNSARNPRIVYCSISAFGQQGPLRERPAHDLAVEALSGVLSITLGQDGKPAIPGLPLADLSPRCTASLAC